MQSKSLKKIFLAKISKPFLGLSLFGTVISTPIIYLQNNYSNTLSLCNLKYQSAKNNFISNSGEELTGSTPIILEESPAEELDNFPSSQNSVHLIEEDISAVEEEKGCVKKSSDYEDTQQLVEDKEIKKTTDEKLKLDMSFLTQKLKEVNDQKLSYSEKVLKLKDYYSLLAQYRNSLIKVGFASLGVTAYSWFSTIFFRTDFISSACLTGEFILLLVEFGLVSYELYKIDDFLSKSKLVEYSSFYKKLKSIVSSISHVSVVGINWCMETLFQDSDRQKFLNLISKEIIGKDLLVELNSYYENESIFKQVFDFIEMPSSNGTKVPSVSDFLNIWGEVKDVWSSLKDTFSSVFRFLK